MHKIGPSFTLTTEYFDSAEEASNSTSEQNGSGGQIETGGFTLSSNDSQMLGYFLYFDFQNKNVVAVAKEADGAGNTITGSTGPHYETDFYLLNDKDPNLSEKWIKLYEGYKEAKQAVSYSRDAQAAGLNANSAKVFDAFLKVSVENAIRDGSKSVVKMDGSKQDVVAFPTYSEAVDEQRAQISRTNAGKSKLNAAQNPPSQQTYSGPTNSNVNIANQRMV
jgi:hypothetical protein